MPSPSRIHDPVFVASLFDRMAKTYGRTNYFSSFGFSERWRRQCVNAIDWQKHSDGPVYDLMSGMGECWNLVRRKSSGHITGVDISPVMVNKSHEQITFLKDDQIDVLHRDVLKESFNASADVIVCSFGLKHFSEPQLKQLAVQVRRLLRPGGQFSFVEISVPQAAWLRWPFMLYLKYVIPLIGKYFSRDDVSYRYLGLYTTKFGNCQDFANDLADTGLDVTFHEYFFGCATGVVGRRPLGKAPTTE